MITKQQHQIIGVEIQVSAVEGRQLYAEILILQRILRERHEELPHLVQLIYDTLNDAGFSS